MGRQPMWGPMGMRLSDFLGGGFFCGVMGEKGVRRKQAFSCGGLFEGGCDLGLAIEALDV